MSKVGTALALVVMMVVTAACADDAGTGERLTGRQPSISAPVMPSWISCAAARSSWPSEQPGQSSAAGQRRDILGPRRLDKDFVAVAAIVCDEKADRRADGTVLKVATESRADDVTALVTALHLSDDPLANAACQQDNRTVYEWLALLDQQGRWVHPGLPRDACGQPLREVYGAIHALELTEVSNRTVEDPKWSAATAAGCARQEQDEAWVIGVRFGEQVPGRVLLPRSGVPVRCFYRVPASTQRTAAGELAGGGPVPTDRWTAIKKAVLAAEPAKACTTPASSFGLLQTFQDGRRIYVEMDGCQRIWASKMRQASPQLIALLDNP